MSTAVGRATYSAGWLIHGVTFVAGNVIAQCQSELRGLPWLCAAIAMAMVCAYFRRTATLFVALGFCWGCAAAHKAMNQRLDDAMHGIDVIAIGYVLTPPEHSHGHSEFHFEIEHVRRANGRSCDDKDGQPSCFAGRVRVRSYGKDLSARAGERWQMTLRLRSPRGLRNPNGFDVQRWALINRIDALAQLRSYPGAQRLSLARAFDVAGVRQTLTERIDSLAQPADVKAVLKALAIGVRGDLTQAQWDALRVTGTGHLLAISGLHISLVAAMAFALTRFAWLRFAAASLSFYALDVAAVAAGASGLAYASLAGMSVTTQRAVIMLCIALLALVTRRVIAPSAAFGAALFCVVLNDPFSVLSAGMWLSFSAVGLILIVSTGRVRLDSKTRNLRSRLRSFAYLQFLLAIGLAPLSLYVFAQTPLLGSFANFVAVPWTTALVVPAVLIGALCSLVDPRTGDAVFTVACWCIERLLDVILWCADHSAVLALQGTPPWWSGALAMIGVVILMLPRGVFWRWAGLAWFMPLLSWSGVSAPAPGELHVTVLDVGQGLAVVLRAGDGALVYDAGPAYPSGFDAGRSVVAPFLRAHDVSRLDALVVSHGDMDHAGGALAVEAAHAPRQVLTNSHPWRLRGTSCLTGRTLSIGAYEARVLHPSEVPEVDNNESSCVMMVSGAGGHVLLSGDIESGGEQTLLAQAESLRADVLLVPHHGSATSSSERFIDAVMPRFALIANGYQNRFGFPHPVVEERYRTRGTCVLQTAQHGALTLILGPQRGRVRVAKATPQRYWHQTQSNKLCTEQ